MRPINRPCRWRTDASNGARRSKSQWNSGQSPFPPRHKYPAYRAENLAKHDAPIPHETPWSIRTHPSLDTPVGQIGVSKSSVSAAGGLHRSSGSAPRRWTC
jgi:hypothetical protein